MRYEEIPVLSREEIERDLTSGDEFANSIALLSAALYDPDAGWVEKKCIEFLRSSSTNHKYVALVSLGHLVRLHGFLNLSKVLPLLEITEKDPCLSGDVDLLRHEIKIFMTDPSSESMESTAQGGGDKGTGKEQEEEERGGQA